MAHLWVDPPAQLKAHHSEGRNPLHVSPMMPARAKRRRDESLSIGLWSRIRGTEADIDSRFVYAGDPIRGTRGSTRRAR